MKSQCHYKVIPISDNQMVSLFRIVMIGFLAVLVFILPLPTGASMKPFKVDYVISMGGLRLGDAQVELSRVGDGQYVYKKMAESNGLASLFISDSITERSEWRLVEGQAKAMRFESSERDGKKLKRELISFDWSNNRALTTWKDHTQEMVVPQGAVDRLTLEMRMMMDMKTGTETFEYPLLERGKLKQRRFVPQGEENVKTKAGRFDAVKYRLVRGDNDKRSTLFWLARELNYLPVRMEHHDKGHGFVVAMELSRIHSPEMRLK
jgi:hypothetical protein